MDSSSPHSGELNKTMKKDILSMDYNELEESVLALGEKKFRAGQIFEWLHKHKVQDFNQMTNLSAQFRTVLDEYFYIYSLKIVKKLVSGLDNTVKYLYKLNDGAVVEAVVMNYKHGNSLCISTQVGCKMGCRFCASTIAGFERNLTAGEMLSQLYTAESESGKKISNIVLMGIGEPLDNYDNVTRFLDILSSEDGHDFSLRNVALSTCGKIDKIHELAKKRYGLSLSISLHAPSDELRRQLMPIANNYKISELIEACKMYFEITGRRITFEYALIDGMNDSIECADELASILSGFPNHINLIPINKIDERDYMPSSKDRAAAFKNRLEQGGMSVTIRRTLGADIDAACGQLRKEYRTEDIN